MKNALEHTVTGSKAAKKAPQGADIHLLDERVVLYSNSYKSYQRTGALNLLECKIPQRSDFLNCFCPGTWKTQTKTRSSKVVKFP